MKEWIAISIAAVFACGAAAQSPAPAEPAKPTTKERQADVKSTTGAAAASTTGAQTAKEQAANTKASKQVAKMTTAEKNAYARELNKQMINPENPSGSAAGTAAQQKANVETSKGEPRQTVPINTLGPKTMEKAATK